MWRHFHVCSAEWHKISVAFLFGQYTNHVMLEGGQHTSTRWTGEQFKEGWVSQYDFASFVRMRPDYDRRPTYKGGHLHRFHCTEFYPPPPLIRRWHFHFDKTVNKTKFV
jgi:hypothetical protein